MARFPGSRSFSGTSHQSNSGNRTRLLLALGLSLFFAVLLALSMGRAEGQPGGDEPTVDTDGSGARYVSGELIVTYEEPVPESPARALTEEVGATVEKTLPAVDSQLIQLPEVVEEPDAAERERLLEEARQELEADPAVRSADYNYLRQPAAPNDPLYPKQWSLAKIAAPIAWREATGLGLSGEAVRIAVVDTGADLDHPDLAGKISASKNIPNPTLDADDKSGHGTHVAGIAAAGTNNELGVAGVCPECTLLVAKVEDTRGYITVASVTEAINWSTDNGAGVINASLSGAGAAESERLAIARAVEAGVVVVAAAGNEGSNVKTYPAAYADVISVGATTRDDRRASYSNYGGWLDLVAPGEAHSTIPGGYGTKSGTSMASPTVAGVAGLLLAQGTAPREVESRLAATTVDLGPKGRDNTFGHGRLDAAAAVGARPRNTHPVVTNVSPKPGTKTRSRTVYLRATVRDGQTDLAKSNITLFVNGKKQNFAYTRSTDRLVRKVKLKPGRNQVRIVARDGWGLSTTRTWSFRTPR